LRAAFLIRPAEIVVMSADGVGTEGFPQGSGWKSLSCRARVCRGGATLAVSFSCLGLALGCSEAEPEPVIAGDTGSIRVLANDMDTPTTVAVRNGIAWIAEGQFTHLPTRGGDDLPGPFQVRSVALNSKIQKDIRIDLPGPDYYPEGIAANLATGDLYIGSVLSGAIVKVPNASTKAEVEPFVPPVPELLERGAFGLRVDNARRILWVCDSNLGATPARPGGTLVGINTGDGSVAVRHELPPDSICNDILVDPSGAIFFTETHFGGIYRIAPDLALVENSAELWLEHEALAPPTPEQFGANGIALAGGRLFIANTSAGTLVRVDPNDPFPEFSVSLVTLSENDESPVLLSGPDGVLALSGTRLLVVENGFGGAGLRRLIEIRLDTR
jgi:sugar lactone lactonase YvrE